MFFAQGTTFWYALAIGGALLLIVVAIVGFRKCLVTSLGDHAIVRTGSGGTRVCFDKAMVIPWLHEYELVPISVRTLRYERTGDWALSFKCGTRVELIADLIVRVNRDARAVECAVSFLGMSRLHSVESLREHFASMFNDSLDTIAGQTEYVEFAKDKDAIRERLLKHIGRDLNGMVADDICIHHLRKA